MKAEINRDGVLKIHAETELEQFALGVWMNRNFCCNSDDDDVRISWKSIYMNAGPKNIHDPVLIEERERRDEVG